jgi:Tfp pilus assembly protein PilN
VFRLNLSTRPFYNERAVHLVLGALAVALGLLTVFNAREIVVLSGRNTELRANIAADEARVVDVRQRTGALRSQLQQDELETLLNSAREANALIDRRTFSWTELFNHLEATLPSDVMLTSVRPQVGEDGVTVSVGVLGRSTEAIEGFIRRLEETGAFSQMLSQSESPDDDELVRVLLVGRYAPSRPAGAQAVQASTPTQEGGR